LNGGICLSWRRSTHDLDSRFEILIVLLLLLYQ
jgi:hypothetical protein